MSYVVHVTMTEENDVQPKKAAASRSMSKANTSTRTWKSRARRPRWPAPPLLS